MSNNQKEYQREELHAALVAYLGSVGCADQAVELGSRLNVKAHDQNSDINEHTLPARWGSFLSMQRTIMDLESKEDTSLEVQGTDKDAYGEKYPLHASLQKLTGFSGSILCSTAVDSLGHVVTGGSQGDIRVWAGNNGKFLTFLKNSHMQAVTCLCSDDDWLCSGGEDATIRVWNPAKLYAPIHVLTGHTTPMTAVHSQPDNKLLSVDKKGGICVWDLVGGVQLRNIETNVLVSCSRGIMHKKQYFLFLGDTAGVVHTQVQDIDSNTFEILPEVKVHTKIISALTPYIQCDGELAVVTGSRDGVLKASTVDFSKVLWEKKLSVWVNSSTLHPNEHSLYVAMDNKQLSILDLTNSGLELFTVPLKGYPQNLVHCRTTDTLLLTTADGRDCALELYTCVDKTQEL